MTKFFTVEKKSKKSQARLGTISIASGKIKTPAFVTVATKGTIKTLTPQQIKQLGIQAAFVNTYHLVESPGVEVISQVGGIKHFAALDLPLFSDSGGFQVFSLAGGRRRVDVRGDSKPLVLRITDEGVVFRSTVDGATYEFTPEKSIVFQQKIGSDIIMAFDECTYYPASYEYAAKALDRTHRWLKRCLTTWKTAQSENNNKQYLYGIIQGATFEDLRRKSAEFVVAQGTPGLAIGGVSVGETKVEMRQQVSWVAPYLPSDRPVHLLGVGQIDDIIDLVTYGIDTFDCVEPTRLARMGSLYQWPAVVNCVDDLKTIRLIDITLGKYKGQLEPVDSRCSCFVCATFTKAYLHHLFRAREILGYTLATFHNLWIMELLMERIRQAIVQDKI